MDTTKSSASAPRPTKPKTAKCDGCGERFLLRELIEPHEDNHHNLTYFHSDSLCRECADAAGVIR
jgi:hypothetical protein